MIFSIKFKKYVASDSIFVIIISKFCYKKKTCLVILFNIDQNLKIDFHYIILPFGLTVYLWVKSSRKSLLKAKEIL